jgi:hypothetical protein
MAPMRAWRGNRKKAKLNRRNPYIDLLAQNYMESWVIKHSA